MKLRAASKILEVLDYWNDSQCEPEDTCMIPTKPFGGSVEPDYCILVQHLPDSEYPKKFIKYLEEHEWYFTHTPWPELGSFVIHNKPRNTQNQFNVTGPLKTAKPKNRKK